MRTGNLPRVPHQKVVHRSTPPGRDPVVTEKSDGRMRQVWFERALILAGLVNLVFLQHKRVTGDGYYRYLYLSELLKTGNLPDGDYSLVGPLFATPLWLVEQAIGSPASLVRYHNSILFCGAILSIFLLLRKHIDARLLNRFLLLLVAGSMLATSLNDFYGETFTLVAVGVGILAVVMGGKVLRSAGWTAIVLGAVNSPASMVGLALVTGAQTVWRRRLRVLAALVIGAGLVLLEISLRNGGYVGSHGARTIMPYSGLPGFSYPFVLGLAAILFSFGRGLLYFFPGLALPARQRLHDAAGPGVVKAYQLWMLFTAGLILVYASWWAWHGGFSWGPRFFAIAALPASLALAVRIGDARASVVADLITLLALALSVWVAIASTVYYGHWPPQCYDHGIEELCHFAPEFSQLWYPFLARPSLDPTQEAVLAYYIVVLAWLALPVTQRLLRQGKQASTRWRASIPQWKL